ncbi:uncharacterized protein LOC119742590 [Patiria miniata]|uniref:Uncharacterized protein n=1 Tax=Patiria miniata TaxID=46514 RepID=A0A914BEX5_PATMI|nr:uncharacterized protein LOC119742590 [Patiria miniata]XP_038074624.1 uncharacterized protein LOC119742590 [Patiria miniata]
MHGCVIVSHLVLLVILCSKVIQVSLTLNATFDRIMQRKDNFIGKLKMFLAMQFGLPANAMRDFKLRRGSVIVDFKVSSDATSDVNVEDAVDMMETEVSMGRFGFVYEGEEVQAKPDSFQSAPLEEMPGMAAAGPVYSAIGVMAGIVIMIMSSL